MKFIIEKSEIQQIVDCVILAVSSKPTHPILGNILITADDDGSITAIATNLNLTIAMTTTGNVEIPGNITLPAKLLSESISNMKGVLEIETNTQNCTIKHNNGQCRLVGNKSDDFPTFPETESPTEINLPAKKLQAALEGCLYCATNDETKLVLTGINFDIHNNKWQLASTNGHKLGLVTGTIDNEYPEAICFTVPGKSLAELNKILATCEDNSICNILVTDKIISFNLPNIKVSSRLLEGDYPKINSLIPRSFEHEFVLERKAFESALKRVSHLAERKQKIVKIFWETKESQATLYTEAADIGDAVDSVMMKALPGSSKANIRIGLNIDYALEGLKHISTSSILVRCNKPTQPVIICPVGGLLNQLYLIMPIEIKDGLGKSESDEKQVSNTQVTTIGDETLSKEDDAEISEVEKPPTKAKANNKRSRTKKEKATV
jgi:DNA polymerase III subunit beta